MNLPQPTAAGWQPPADTVQVESALPGITVYAPRLASQRKGWLWAGGMAAAALALLLAGLALTLAGALLPLVAVLGVALIVAAFVAGALALIPAIWPWQWNRKQ